MNFAIIAWYIQYHVNPVHCSSFFVLYFLKFVSVFTTLVVSLSNVCSYVQVKLKLQHPPPPLGQPSGHLNVWKIGVQIPPSSSQIAIQMPPPAEKSHQCLHMVSQVSHAHG